jgi:hypothetical protein
LLFIVCTALLALLTIGETGRVMIGPFEDKL